jgi:glutaryl-CoA dehydrogenase
MVRDSARQYAQGKLADMQTEISLALQGCFRAGQLMNAGQTAPGYRFADTGPG